MYVFRRSKVLALLIVALLILSVAGCSQKTTKNGNSSNKTDNAQNAQKEAANFYKDKVVNFIVPYTPGGGYDEYVRMITPAMGKYLGATVVVKNVPGAGSLVGTNQLYASKADGLTVGIINGMGMVINQQIGAEGIKYDLAKMSWLGRVAKEPRLFIAGSKSPYKNLDEVLKSDKPFKLSMTGVGSGEYITCKLITGILNFKMDMITGYETSAEADLAMLRGEVDGTLGSLSSKIKLVKQNDAFSLLQIGQDRDPSLPDIPALGELKVPAEKEKLVKTLIAMLETGRMVAAPSDVPPERLAFLREAFVKALEDPEVVASAKKGYRPISYLDGPQTEKMVKEAVQLPEDILNQIKEAVK
ncbi:tripartite tricarboxylate transporter substrate binding protein [Desulfosporosinus sp. BICA1-9]|uniref:Bug family tripartite tricarboxylate transporter substrate binding protein n=1 Tax=Desulfosporosinus sp. BICA1-9 TaxID=1531958 RepID=UPI00054C10F8|nr:tripartite tricarboxylate transporter substrate binding protein [Desulfosporosinus sp. BICA1-9]KJS48819.1 MAG: hypothetical protein VR66_11820 [Peptococcaceae bacterium BRH_c23]KJS87091.1 MAG: hypothetical protein JL57_15070 [Desulfosporosinus sp. BICA1-9]HBW34161.1 tripartite tricarboxylate transporter substrate binding protein [Desulfosporosinus sp.]